MPRRRTSLRRRAAAGIDWRTIAYFFFGPDANNCPFSSPAAARPAWERYQKTLLRWWRVGIPPDVYVNPFAFLDPTGIDAPCRRPWAWWKFSAPEPRRLLSVRENGGQRAATDEDRERARTFGLGRSPRAHESAGDVGYFFEDDDAYFRRLNLPAANEEDAPTEQARSPGEGE